MPEFKDIVAQSWAQPISRTNKSRGLHIKMSRLTKALRRWNMQKLADSKREAQQAQGLVLHLDQTQDTQ
jgi:hypothetical protein